MKSLKPPSYFISYLLIVQKVSIISTWNSNHSESISFSGRSQGRSISPSMERFKPGRGDQILIICHWISIRHHSLLCRRYVLVKWINDTVFRSKFRLHCFTAVESKEALDVAIVFWETSQIKEFFFTSALSSASPHSAVYQYNHYLLTLIIPIQMTKSVLTPGVKNMCRYKKTCYMLWYLKELMQNFTVTEPSDFYTKDHKSFKYIQCNMIVNFRCCFLLLIPPSLCLAEALPVRWPQSGLCAGGWEEDSGAAKHQNGVDRRAAVKNINGKYVMTKIRNTWFQEDQK